MQNELASNKNVGAAHLGSLLGNLADHFSILFCVALYGVLPYWVATSNWGSISTAIPYLLGIWFVSVWLVVSFPRSVGVQSFFRRAADQGYVLSLVGMIQVWFSAIAYITRLGGI